MELPNYGEKGSPILSIRIISGREVSVALGRGVAVGEGDSSIGENTLQESESAIIEMTIKTILFIFLVLIINPQTI